MEDGGLAADDEELDTVAVQQFSEDEQPWLLGAFVHAPATSASPGYAVPSSRAARAATAEAYTGGATGRPRWCRAGRTDWASLRPGPAWAAGSCVTWSPRPDSTTVINVARSGQLIEEAWNQLMKLTRTAV